MGIVRREPVGSYRYEAFRLKYKSVLGLEVRDRLGSGDGVSSLQSENET